MTAAADGARVVQAARAAELRRALTAWFRVARRELPWRRTRDPYAIWISEAMLQQTRVEAVLDHYRRFLERFPDVRSLARADEEEILAAWSGLGYYRRARALGAAARALVERHGGGFPRTRDELLALPGIGPYTAGALLSIAFGRPAALVDGNVARVLARLFDVGEPVDLPATGRRLWALAEALLPPAAPDDPREPSPGEWSQALMELGALVCTPRAPRCLACPLAAGCSARAAGRADELPRRSPRRPAVDVRLETLVVRRGDEVLLVRRPRGRRMAGMWELPTRELASVGGGRSGLWPAELPGRAEGVRFRVGEPVDEVSHGITHHRIVASVRRATLEAADRPDTAGDGWRWVRPAALEDLALTGMARKVLSRIPARRSLPYGPSRD